MKALRRFLTRLWSSVLGRRDEERLREEMEEHLARMTEENIRAGMPPAEARRRAALKFGAVEAIKEEYRDQRGLPLVEIVLQDTRRALRRLSHAPVFTLTAVFTLALGIGATTSIFTLVHAVLFRRRAGIAGTTSSTLKAVPRLDRKTNPFLPGIAFPPATSRRSGIRSSRAGRSPNGTPPARRTWP